MATAAAASAAAVAEPLTLTTLATRPDSTNALHGDPISHVSNHVGGQGTALAAPASDQAVLVLDPDPAAVVDLSSTPDPVSRPAGNETRLEPLPVDGKNWSAPTTQPAVGFAPAAPAFEPRLLQTAEAARHSVLHQIALRVDPDGGELRLQLDPPELGRLDLRIIDRDGELSLHIVADRPELSFLLERHVGELRQALAQQGIKISHTNIEGSGSDRGTSHDRGPDDGASRRQQSKDQNGDDQSPRQARGRWLASTGFDFWV